jgi:phosphatidylinositol-3-phosphatase
MLVGSAGPASAVLPVADPVMPVVRPAQTQRPAITKVLTFVVENHSLRQMKTSMPYVFRLAREYAYADHYRAIAHPSLPNYLAMASGGTHGVTDDGAPSEHPLNGQTVFDQALALGQTATIYADSMTRRCQLDSSGLYAVKHNPWAYFVDERTGCRRHDLPAARLGRAIRSGHLPNVGMVIPDLCNDAHDCDLSDADAWFRGVMRKVFAGPDWKSGRLAVILTADEDEHDNQGNTVLTMVLHGSQQAQVVDTPLTHYSLSGLLSAVTGTPPLGEARTAPSMAAAFELPLARG